MTSLELYVLLSSYTSILYKTNYTNFSWLFLWGIIILILFVFLWLRYMEQERKKKNKLLVNEICFYNKWWYICCVWYIVIGHDWWPYTCSIVWSNQSLLTSSCRFLGITTQQFNHTPNGNVALEIMDDKLILLI